MCEVCSKNRVRQQYQNLPSRKIELVTELLVTPPVPLWRPVRDKVENPPEWTVIERRLLGEPPPYSLEPR